MEIESNLSFVLHRDKIYGKITLLKQYSHKYHDIDMNSSSILYNRMLKHALLYGITLWKNKPKTKLDVIHHHAANICSGNKRQSGNAFMLFALNWHSLEKHIIQFAI